MGHARGVASIKIHGPVLHVRGVEHLPSGSHLRGHVLVLRQPAFVLGALVRDAWQVRRLRQLRRIGLSRKILGPHLDLCGLHGLLPPLHERVVVWQVSQLDDLSMSLLQSRHTVTVSLLGRRALLQLYLVVKVVLHSLRPLIVVTGRHLTAVIVTGLHLCAGSGRFGFPDHEVPLM